MKETKHGVSDYCSSIKFSHM